MPHAFIRFYVSPHFRNGTNFRSGRTVFDRTIFLAAVITLAFGLAISTRAIGSTSQICDNAAFQASQETGVPLEVLRTITRTETGRARNGRLEPWPWTVNMEGKGRWFASEDEARTYVFKHFKRGARSFDVGCFQINYRWHGQAFNSIDQMFDPLANARYAANFLKSLHAETGNWSKAAGTYHSRTPVYSNRYRARFDKIRSSLSDHPMPPDSGRRPDLRSSSSDGRHNENAFPLLQDSSQRRSPGSLVPLDAGGGLALIDAVTRMAE